MTKILFILLGGAAGSLARYLISEFTNKIFETNFPIGTLLVNLTGCLIIGIIWGVAEQENISENIRLFLFIGILGGFTTFSTFSIETINLFKNNQIIFGILNILGNNILGILLTLGGFILINKMYNILH